jgi:TRAP transporter TAXI family solute receptor
MEMKRIMTIILIVSFCLVGLAIGAYAEKAIDLTWVGGGTGGISYHQGAALSGYISKKVPKYKISVQSSSGAIEMMRLLGREEVELSVTVGSEAEDVWFGRKPFKRAYPNVRSLGVAFLAPLNWVTVKDKNIRKISDLKGKTISPGPIGSSGANSINRMLTFLGIKDQVKLNYLPYAESGRALKQGHIDLYNVFGVPPHAVISETFATVSNATIFDFGNELEESGFYKKFPGYVPAYLKAGSYPGLDKEVKTYGTTYIFMAREDLPEEIAYDITRILYSDDFIEYAQKVIEGPFKLQEELMKTGNPTAGTGCPLHPGAEKAFKELGYKILSPSTEDMKKK